MLVVLQMLIVYRGIVEGMRVAVPMITLVSIWILAHVPTKMWASALILMSGPAILLIAGPVAYAMRDNVYQWIGVLALHKIAGAV